MAEPPPRGRGRAALFAKKADEPVPIGRGRAFTSISTSSSNVGKGDDIPKPRGRGALFRQVSLNVESTTSESTYHDSGARTAVSEGRFSSAFETGTYISAASSGTSSGDSESSKRKGLGRAALFGLHKTEVKEIDQGVAKLGIEETSPQTKPRVARSSPGEKNPPVIKHGDQGKKVQASANYIKLEFINRDKGIYEYEVSFKPEVDADCERIYVVNQHFRSFGGKTKVFDGGWRVFTPDKLKNDVNIAKSTLRSGLEVELKLTYKRVKKFDECKYILNIIFKRIMNELNLVKFGRSDFNPNAASKITEHKLEIWPGCVTAIDEYEGGISLCCDASHRVLRSETCLEMIMEIMKMRRESDWKKDVSTALIGISVITNYNKKVMRVDDIDFSATPTSTFKRGDQEIKTALLASGENRSASGAGHCYFMEFSVELILLISYVDYYKTQYNIDIKEKKQPLLVHRAKRKPLGKEKVDVLLYLVPELCSPTGLTDSQRNNFRLMKEVATVTRVSPQERQNALRAFVRGIKQNERANAILNEWNLQLPDTTIDLIARVFDPERIHFGRQQSVVEPNADWGRAASNNHVISAIDLKEWAIIFTSRDGRVANGFLDSLKDVARKIGMYVNKPESVAIASDQARTYCQEIKRLYRSAQILVLIFPSNRDDRYASVKKLCNSELGIASQVINSKTISNPKNLKSIVTKIALQMNCKIGGALWGISLPYQNDGIMFCGIDAYHDALRRSHSVIALVTSLNNTCTRWSSGTSIHNRGQEISDVITGLLRDCLEMWHKTNNSFPARIVMFRDGVGDGQLSVVRDHEVPQFYKLFSLIQSSYKPKLTYIVVQKRINTRMYIKERGQYDNPKPGTVIDHTITRRDWYDYFLVSQNVRQGTVSPTHYVVVHDESDMPVDMVQKLSYKMTHLYYNWNGTVRVPAPCQYAHKLAYLVGQHMHAPATQNLRNVLYFL